MKITKLHIDSFSHLSNIKFDFTYPEGHAKAGQPLDKICIIGQSATGKTSVIEGLKDALERLHTNQIRLLANQRIKTETINLQFDGAVGFIQGAHTIVLEKQSITITSLDKHEVIYTHHYPFLAENVKAIYLSADIISKQLINIFSRNPLELLTKTSDEKDNRINDYNLKKSYIYEFAQEVDEKIWLSLLSKILDYRKRFTQMASELINNGAIGNPSKLNIQYEKWAEQNENPLVAFA